MSKPSRTQQVIMVARAAADPAIGAASRADLDAALLAAERGASIGPAVARALAAARSRAFEAVADAALAAAADGAPRSARSRLRQAVASAAAVRALELRLSGDSDDAQNDTAVDVDVDPRNVTVTDTADDVVQHDESDTESGADWGTQNDNAEVFG